MRWRWPALRCGRLIYRPQLDGPARTVRLLSDHRDHLVAERTRVINRLRWHLHELDPGHEPPARTLWRPKHLQTITAQAGFDGVVARLARVLIEDVRRLNDQIRVLEGELRTTVEQLTPALLAICGCSTLTAAKIVGETADVRRFRSRHAFARHNGTAPLPVWSSNQSRHRLSRTGTDNSTRRSTGSRSPKPTAISRLATCWRDAPGTARTKRSHYAYSNVEYPMSSTGPLTPTPNLLPPRPTRRVVDIGASGRNCTLREIGSSWPRRRNRLPGRQRSNGTGWSSSRAQPQRDRDLE
jgi:hypothetical protein